MIKQLIPVPDGLTAVELIIQEDDTKLWEDTTKNGTPVFLALTDDDKVLPYLIDNEGMGDLDADIRFRPAIRCPICGQKMWIRPHADLSKQLEYECPCGHMRRVELE